MHDKRFDTAEWFRDALVELYSNPEYIFSYETSANMGDGEAEAEMKIANFSPSVPLEQVADAVIEALKLDVLCAQTSQISGDRFLYLSHPEETTGAMTMLVIGRTLEPLLTHEVRFLLEFEAYMPLYTAHLHPRCLDI